MSLINKIENIDEDDIINRDSSKSSSRLVMNMNGSGTVQEKSDSSKLRMFSASDDDFEDTREPSRLKMTIPSMDSSLVEKSESSRLRMSPVTDDDFEETNEPSKLRMNVNPIDEVEEINDVDTNINSNISKQSISLNENTVTTNYDFGEYTDMVNQYLTYVYSNSVTRYNSEPLEHLYNNISCLNDYLNYNYQCHRERFSSIFDAVTRNLVSITETTFVPRLFGTYDPHNKSIRIRNDFSDSDLLRYLGHKIEHLVNFDWLSNNVPIVDEFEIYGIKMIEQAVTQERCEELVSYYSGTTRDDLSPRNSSLFDGETYYSNFRDNDVYQEPAIMFGRTLDGMSSLSDTEVMELLAKKALSPDFLYELYDEFSSKNKTAEFKEILQCLGKIYCAYDYSLCNKEEMLKESKANKDKLGQLTSMVMSDQSSFRM